MPVEVSLAVYKKIYYIVLNVLCLSFLDAHLQSKMFKSAGEQSANEKLNDYYLWNMYRDGKTRKLFSLGQYKWMSKTKYNTRYNDKKLKQLVVLTKENATLKYRNKLYKEEIKRLQAIERRIVEELKIN